jgi:hypothetical protein
MRFRLLILVAAPPTVLVLTFPSLAFAFELISFVVLLPSPVIETPLTCPEVPSCGTVKEEESCDIGGDGSSKWMSHRFDMFHTMRKSVT